MKGFSRIPGLLEVIQATGLAPRTDPARLTAACELVLEGLVAQKRISRSDELGYARVRPERHPGGGSGGGGPSMFQ